MFNRRFLLRGITALGGLVGIGGTNLSEPETTRIGQRQGLARKNSKTPNPIGGTSPSPGREIRLSSYGSDSFLEADRAATLNGLLIHDIDATLTADTTLSAKAHRPAGGIITLGNYNLTVTGAIESTDAKWLNLTGSGKLILDTSHGVRWNNVVGRTSPEMLGAGSIAGTSNDTALVETAWNATSIGGRPILHHRDYYVTTVTLNSNERNLDGQNNALRGIASAAAKYVLKLSCGYSNVRDLKVDAQGKSNYESAVGYFTHELSSGEHFPSYNNFWNLTARNAKIGLNIGALPSQNHAIPASDQTDMTRARNAPVSETSFFGYRAFGCPIPLRAEQSNGKLTFVAPQLVADTASFGGSKYGGRVAALYALNASELSIIGGSMEAQFDGATTNRWLFNLEQDTNLALFGTIVESSYPASMGNRTRFFGAGLKDFGWNYSGDCVQVTADSDGDFTLENTVWVRAQGYGTTGAKSILAAVTAVGGSYSAASNFHARFRGVEFRDCMFGKPNVIGAYVPLTRGIRSHFSECRLTSYDGNISRVVDLRLHDGEEKLHVVDQTTDTIAPYPQSGAQAQGGWNFETRGAAARWGSQRSDVPKVLDENILAALYLNSSSAGSSLSATTPQFPVSQDKNDILRMWLKASASGGNLIVIAFWYGWDGTAKRTPYTVLFSGADKEFTNIWQPVMFLFRPPAGTGRMALQLRCENAAWMKIANPSVR